MYRSSTEILVLTPDEQKPSSFDRNEAEEGAEAYNSETDDGTIRRSIAEPPVVTTSG